MNISEEIKNRVAAMRSGLNYDPDHSLDGKRGCITSCDHSHSEVSLREKSATGKIQWSVKKNCFELMRAVNGIVYDAIFVPDTGQEVTYLIAVNEQFIQEFKPIL